MRYAIWSPTNPREGVSHVELYRQQIAEIELAEALGFDHIWLYEHHVSPSGPMPSPNLLLAAAAKSTRRIRLGAMVNILPYRNPLLVAEEAAMLDVLTDGRLDIGIGRGLKPLEFDTFCIEQGQSREMFLESLGVIRRIFADETFAHHGRHYHINKQSPLCPPPVQRPHPPFIVSAQSEESLRFAAENDFAFAQIDALIEDCERDQAIYRDIQAAHGHAPASRLIVTREVFIADTDEAAWAQAQPYLTHYWQIWQRYSQLSQEGRMPDDYEFWRKTAPRLHAMGFEELRARGLVMIGSPETVARQLIEHERRLDLFALACVFKFGAMPYGMMENSMRLFAREVMPRVAAAQGSASAA